MNYYEVLGVPKTASQDEIKKAYRKLASQHHPDRGGDTAKFQEIQSAYDTLGDENKRAAYDNPAPNHQSFNFNFGPDNLHDIFAQFGFGGNPFQRVHPRKNNDIRTTINLELKDTLVDQRKTLLIQSNNSRKNVDINIPRGITSGTTIRYPGLGDNLFPNIPPGDLYVTLNIIPDPKFMVSGLDIIQTLTIDCFQAILGTEQTVMGLDGKLFNVKIHAGCQPNTKLKIPGEGLWAFQKDVKGNLLIQIQISVPTNLTQEQLNLIKQITTQR